MRRVMAAEVSRRHEQHMGCSNAKVQGKTVYAGSSMFMIGEGQTASEEPDIQK